MHARLGENRDWGRRQGCQSEGAPSGRGSGVGASAGGGREWDVDASVPSTEGKEASVVEPSAMATAVGGAGGEVAATIVSSLMAAGLQG